jgi:ketosteroid isomerase-like protein
MLILPDFSSFVAEHFLPILLVYLLLTLAYVVWLLRRATSGYVRGWKRGKPPKYAMVGEQRAAIAETVREMNAEWWAAWDSGDVERYLGYWSDWSFSPAAGFPSVESHHSWVIDQRAKLNTCKSELGRTRVRVFGTDGAVLEGLSVVNATDENGAELTWTVNYTVLFARQSRQWKIVLTRFHPIPVGAK